MARSRFDSCGALARLPTRGRALAITQSGRGFRLVQAGRGKGGDNPPRPECRKTWHPQLIPLLTNVRLTLLIGQYAQAYFLRERRKASLTATVQAFDEYLPDFIPTVHPSPRNQGWLKRHAWFERDLLPVLRERVHALL